METKNLYNSGAQFSPFVDQFESVKQGVTELETITLNGKVDAQSSMYPTFVSGSFNKWGNPSIPSTYNNNLCNGVAFEIDADRVDVEVASGYVVMLGLFTNQEIAIGNRYGEAFVEYSANFSFVPADGVFYAFSVHKSDYSVISLSEASNITLKKIESKKIYGYDNPDYNIVTLMSQNKNDLFKSAKTPILTYVDDDCPYDGIAVVKGICDELGIKCTFGCIGNRIDADSASFVSGLKERLIEYQSQGYHITSHTYSHDGWYSTSGLFTLDQCENDLIKSLRVMVINGFLESNFLVSSGSSIARDGIDKIIKKWCVAAFGGDNGVNTMYGNGRFKVTRKFIDKTQHADASYYTALIDSAVDNGSWIVLATHSGNSSQFDADLTKQVLQYAKTKGIRIATANEALKIRMGMYQMYELFE